jgi:CHAT domain-containing protein
VSPASGFCIDWFAGATAQVELFSPGPGAGGDTYRLKYTPPFRSTIRPPLEELRLGSEELTPIRDRLNQLAVAVDARGGGAAGAAAPDDTLLEETKLIGGQLLNLIMPGYVQGELRSSDLFLEIGMDEALLEYPWELMHDDDDFLCFKHLVGRFVNSSKPAIPSLQRAAATVAATELSVLLISVPQPQPRGNVKYDPLPAAAAETQAILETLAPLGDAAKVSLLQGPKAKYDDVYKAIKSGRYHIVHFSGHAYFRNDKPHLSSLVLFDRDMSTGPIMGFFGSKPPVFFFMNACETAAAKTEGEWKNRFDIFGLARAFLETGAYLIGNRWQVGDAAAAAFAKAFYSALVEGKPLGRAVRDARIACRNATGPTDFSWASYLFYGDPRVYFRRV